MNEVKKLTVLQKILAQKNAAQNPGGNLGIIANSDLSKKFQAGEKQQPKIRRGGRNGSGKP